MEGVARLSVGQCGSDRIGSGDAVLFTVGGDVSGARRGTVGRQAELLDPIGAVAKGLPTEFDDAGTDAAGAGGEGCGE